MKREEEEKIASMEPRTHARGNKAEFDQADLVLSASMEPRTHARGNIADQRSSSRAISCFNGATHSRAWKPPTPRNRLKQEPSLQWSHALTRVETGYSDTRIPLAATLQWSHALTRVETQLDDIIKREQDQLQWSHALTRVETISPFVA